MSRVPAAGLRIGLTGGIGSGKSTVARLLAQQGAWVVDTDALARTLTQPGGAAMPAIREAFGPDMVDPQGALDRDRMRALVFAEPQARQRLEQILHPMIQALTQQEAARAAPGQTVVFDVPLLVESGERWRRQVDRVLVIDCSEATQVARVMARNHWPEAQVRQVMTQQATREARRAVADEVILNDGLSLDALQQAVSALWRKWHAQQAVGSATL